MHTTTNDLGEQVIAAGEPGSIVWCQTMYPGLIESVNALTDATLAEPMARHIAGQHWEALLRCTKFKNQL